jgi:polyisoprenoid-binding protein YceI
MEHKKSTWSIDPDHSEIQFKVKHLAISNIAGTFKAFKGDVISPNEDFDNAKINLVIDANSINTQHEIRDGHLKGEEFFNTPQFPQITFSGLLQKQTNKYELTGNLTIRQNTLPIVLNVEFTGTGKGRNGDIRAGFEVNGKINRKDYGLTWSMLTETGGLMIGEEIKLHFDIQLIKQ